MREYIIYVILVFLPIGAIMAYLLQKEGVPRKNAAMVVGISWLIIVTFPLSIAKMGTFIALMTYIVAILVMTRFLLGSKKEYAIESKGILVTGSELEQLLVNMERQGYEILTGQDSDYVSLGGEPVLSNLPGSQINELGLAEISALADGDNNEPSLEDIKKTKEKDLAKPDMLNDSPADAMISVSIVDKEQEELHDQTAEEFPAEDVKDMPHAGNEFSMEESLAELASSSMVDVEMEAPDEDILAKSAVEEAVILEDMIADERAASELERLEEPEIGWPSLGEEPSEEIVEAFSKEIEVEPDEELENEAGETVEITLEAISEAIVPEVPEAEHTAEAEPIERSLPTLEEDMAAVAGDGFELEMDNKIENDDSEVILEKVTAELEAEPEEDDTIDDNIPEDSDQLVEEQSELPGTNDIPAMDESITAEEDRPEPIEEIITEADEASAVEDLETGRAIAEPIEKSLATLEEDMAAVAGDGFELEMDNKIENDDSEVILEEVTAELNAEPEEDVTIEDNIAEYSDQVVEKQSELPETNDIPAMDEPITAEEDRPEPIEEIITEADEASVMEDWEAEHTAEAEPIERSLPTLEEDMAAVAGDGFELEMDNKIENDDSEVILEEVTAELNVEPEEDDTIEDNIAEDSDQVVEKQSELPETNDIPAMDEPITAEGERPEPIEEIIAEADEASAGEDLEAGRAEAELLPESIPESSASLETDEIEHLDKAGELQAPMENLLLEEATAFEVPRESAADSEKPAESGQFKAEEVPSSAKQLLELIEQGFTLKEMGKWQEAGQCFMDADALTEDTELKELLNMEIINIFQLLAV